MGPDVAAVCDQRCADSMSSPGIRMPRKPPLPKAARGVTAKRSPARAARVSDAAEPRDRSAATSELYKLLEAKEHEAGRLQGEVQLLRRRTEDLETESTRQGSQVRDARSTIHEVGRERDQLRQKLDDVVIDMEIKNP